jgi:hypothetical protein
LEAEGADADAAAAVNVVSERVNMSTREDRVDKDTVRHDDDVNVVRERVNMSAREDRVNKDTVRHVDNDGKEKTVKKHQYEEPEGRDVMSNINPKGKHDKLNVVRERVNMSAREDRLDKDTRHQAW